MRASRDLGALHRQAAAQLGRLRAAANSVLGDITPHSRKIIGSTVIDLLNAWSGFSRGYYLSCITRPRREQGGRVVARTFAGSTFTDAISVAMQRHRPTRRPRPGGGWERRDEPPWHDTAVLLASCMDLGCSNITQIQAALSTGSAVFQHLPVFRNFFAHRNDATAAKARNIALFYSIPSSRKHPAEVLRSPPHGRPFPLLLEWMDDIELTVELICV
jgi:hypothetical protein